MLVIYFLFKKISFYLHKHNKPFTNNATEKKIKINRKKKIKINKKVKNNIKYFLKTQELTENSEKKTFSLLRKQRFFSKSKYSRTRQYCKNIVYLGLLINIVAVYSINSIFYGITLNFYKVMFIGVILLLIILPLLNKFKFFKKIFYFIFKK